MTQQWYDVFQYLKTFARYPIKTMGTTPPWPVVDLKITLSLLVCISAISGFLSGLFSKSLLVLLTSVLFFPISGLILSFAGSSVFYILFLFIYKEEEVNFLCLHRVIVIAILPYQVLRMFMGFTSLQLIIDSIALIITIILIAEGFTQQLRLPRRSIWTTTLIIGILVFSVKILPPFLERDQNIEDSSVLSPPVDVLEEK